MYRWFDRFARGRPTAATLNLLILPVLLITMLVFGELSVQIYRQTISDHVRNELQALTNSSADYLDNFLSEAMRQSYFIYSNRAFRDTLEKTHELGEKISIQDTMEFYYDTIDPLFTALNNPEWFVNRVYLLEESLHADRSSICYMDQFPEGIPIEEAMQAKDTYIWSIAREKKGPASAARNLLCYTRLITAENGAPIAFLNTEIYLDVLEPVVAKAVQAGMGGAYLWKLHGGDVIFQSDDFSDSYWTARSIVENNNSSLETGYSNDLIDRQAYEQHLLLVVLSLFMVLLAFLLIYLISRLSLNRIRQVAEKFTAFGQAGTMGKAYVLEGRDEAAKLDQVLTDLYRKYLENTQAYYRLENAYHVMEYQMLMSKINPHFLYNTLSAIRWSVLGNDKQEAADAVDHLVAFYRGVLGRGRDVQPLQMEVHTLSEYVELQAYAYSRRIRFEADLSPDTAVLFIRKFLLQPVVENAILHGNSEQERQIKLQAYPQDGKLCVVIWNNGRPMEPSVRETMNRLNELDARQLSELTVAQNGKDSYGIYNILSRIRLLYGEGYGLWYETPPQGGTSAIFLLPWFSDPGGEACINPSFGKL